MSGMPPSGSAVRVDRIVAVAATLPNEREQLGSGYLVTGRLVLTAEHCTRDKATGEPAAQLRVVRASDGAVANVAHVVSDHKLDVAVLQLADDAPWDADLPLPEFARVDQSQAGVLDDCTGIGFPLFQRDPDRQTRHTSEFHGTVYQTDERESGRLLMREPLIHPGPITGPGSEAASALGAVGPSPWGGLSGALMFYRGSAIGVVVEHHPRQGDSALLAVGFERIASSAEIRQCLGLPEPGNLPYVTEQAAVPLAGLVELIDGDDLSLLADLDPYRLGATPSEFGDSHSYGQRDPYVLRTRDNLDSRLRAALQPGRLVLLVGPSKSGKTRTAFEAARQCWPQARLLAPTPAGLNWLITHPRLENTTDPIVVWMDDMQRFLTGTDPLTPATLTGLFSRPGPTMVLATLRQEERARLRAATGELTRDTRQLLEDARDTTFELGPTSDDPDEQAAARASYPTADLSTTGLGEQLAGAPTLLSQYDDARYSDPLLHAVVQTAIDWARVGMARPIPGTDLGTLAIDALLTEQPDLEPSEHQIAESITVARTPPTGAGRVAALRTVLLPDRSRGYRPFDYLVAADDGQTGRPRAIPDPFWDQALALAAPDEALAIAVVASQRDNVPAAIHAAQQAAAAGNTNGMFAMGYLLSDQLDPPELAEARTWFHKAADAGNANAMDSLGYLLVDLLDPPDLTEARSWWQKAADAGHADAMYNLGHLLSVRLDPPELGEARTWLQKAAEAGHIKAMDNLGYLLSEQIDPPELGEARSWYRKAAEAGDTDAMYRLGYLLSVRLDPPEPTEARTWLQKATDAGNTDAMVAMGMLASLLDPPELGEARTWYEKAAEAGNTDAMNNLGYLVAEQLDPAELGEARTWYQKAADAGNRNAMYNLGYLLSEQIDPPELDAARTWYQKAADAVDTDAMVGLGYLLSKLLDPPELAEGRIWYQKAAEAGNARGAYDMGMLCAAQGDVDGALGAWQRVIDEYQENVPVAAAALGLAAVSLLRADLKSARELLDIAGAHGSVSASVCATAFDPDPVVRADGRRRLHDFGGDTDALNYLGIAAYTDHQYEEAQSYWTRSSGLGDAVSPLLMHLTTGPSSPREN